MTQEKLPHRKELCLQSETGQLDLSFYGSGYWIISSIGVRIIYW